MKNNQLPEITTIQIGQIYHNDRFDTLVKVREIKGDYISYSSLDFDGNIQTEQYGGGNEELFLNRYTLLRIPLKDAFEIGEKIMSGEIPYVPGPVVQEGEDFENDSAVISADAKKVLQAKVKALQKTQEGLENLRASFKLAMNKKHSELEKIRRSMDTQLTQIRRLVRRIVRVIESIELYLGISEEMVRFQEGEPAPMDEPIVFRQLALYMDEEVANTTGGGWDINNLEDFEKWLRVPANLEQVMPEQKGMVAFRPRRHKKDYGDAWYDSMMHQQNSKTFFLIRNGENLTHIFTENLQVGSYMFPGRVGMEEVQKRAQNAYSDREKEEIKDEIQDHARLALFFQGLIDRSDVFHPHAPGISIFNEGGAPHVRFLYDAEDLLPDGRKRFKDWQAEINQNIQRGSRIVLAEKERFVNEWRGQRWTRWYSDRNTPEHPQRGLYSVEENEKMGLHIMYNPGGWVYSWTDGFGDRKNRMGYKIEKDDKFILNYDLIDLADIDFYLNNRIDRPNYLTMMPLLREMKRQRLEEMFREKEFARALAFECGVTEGVILAAVEWWKMKVIMKRPLDKDDAKAWRMIKAKVLREKE